MSASPRQRRRAARLMARTFGGLVLLCLAALSLCAGCVAALPTVAGAPTLAARIEAQHHESGGRPVPHRLAAAVVASEDGHFEDDVLINVLDGAARAGGALITGSGNPGGATIDQQLAKALYGPQSGSLDTLRQLGLGIRLGLAYSHRQVLAMYLNVNYFGDGLWGVSAAAEGYFGVSASHLSWAEAAMVAGLLQAPSAYEPIRHYALAKARQHYVLQRLVEDGVISSCRERVAYRARLPLRRDGR